MRGYNEIKKKRSFWKPTLPIPDKLENCHFAETQINISLTTYQKYAKIKNEVKRVCQNIKRELSQEVATIVVSASFRKTLKPTAIEIVTAVYIFVCVQRVEDFISNVFSTQLHILCYFRASKITGSGVIFEPDFLDKI